MPSPEKGDDEGIGSDTDDELFAGFRPATNVPSEPVSEFLFGRERPAHSVTSSLRELQRRCEVFTLVTFTS